MTDIHTAAQARSLATGGPKDKPSQRRCAADSRSEAFVTVRASSIQLRAAADDSGPMVFEGYASVTDRAYEMFDMFGPYTEQVSRGAFKKTLASEGLDVPLVIGHDPDKVIARTTNSTLSLSEDETGLLVRAQLDPTDFHVQVIAPKLRSGLVDEMSFKFTITDGEWSPDFDEYHIKSVDLARGDVSIVTYGANPYTAGAGLRSSDLAKLSEDALKRLQSKVGAELRTRSQGMSFAALELLATEK